MNKQHHTPTAHIPQNGRAPLFCAFLRKSGDMKSLHSSIALLKPALILAKNEEKNIKIANEIKNRLEKEKIIFNVKTGNDGKVFGSISSKQICEKLNELGYNINKKMLISDENLSSLGNFYIDVQLYKGVIAKIKIELIKK